MSVTRTCNEWPLAYETKHKTFTIMSKKALSNENSGRKPSNAVNVCGPKSGETEDFYVAERQSVSEVFDAIDQMHEASVIANRQKKTMDNLRPQVERAIARELRRQHLGKYYTGELQYHGYTIRIQRRTIIQFMTDADAHDGAHDA